MKATDRRQELWKAVLSLRNAYEADRFFGDLLTAEEIEDFAKRWQVARMLDSGASYVDIRKATDLSTRTIARISSWLKEGLGGYRLMLARLGDHHHALSAHSRRVLS